MNNKIYSPDIIPYSMEGTSGIFNTVSSIIVGPIRIVSRVLHNICVLPANLKKHYADGLLLVSLIMSVLGAIDLFIFNKWILLVSQLPLIFYSMRLKKEAKKSIRVFKRKREVEINTEDIEHMCDTVYDDLDKIFK